MFTQQQDARQLWSKALNELKGMMSRATFDAWVKPTQALSFDGLTLTVLVRNAYTKQWLDNRLYVLVQRAMRTVADSPNDIEVVFTLSTQISDDDVKEDQSRTHAATAQKSNTQEEKPALDDLDDETEIDVEGDYLDRRNEIIRPEKICITTEYFETQWSPHLGPVLTRTIVRLRRRAYKNKKTGERRNELTTTLNAIAKEVGVHEETIRNALLKPCTLCPNNTTCKKHEKKPRSGTKCKQCAKIHHIADHFILASAPKYRMSAKLGKVIRCGVYFRVLLDDPLLPEHETKLRKEIKNKTQDT